MSDIFISYASEDRDHAKTLARALEEVGWSVWWDRTIPAGRTFNEVIVEALAETRCMVVLWSTFSVQKNWVLEESEEGLQRGILVPVFIEDVQPPLGFRRIQAAYLVNWNGESTSASFQKLVADLTRILGEPPVAIQKSQKADEARKAREGRKADPEVAYTPQIAEKKYNMVHFLVGGFLFIAFVTAVFLLVQKKNVVEKPFESKPAEKDTSHQIPARSEIPQDLFEEQAESPAQIPTGATGTLFIKTKPPDATIRILNIRPRYRPGMDLEQGDYHIKVSRGDYEPQERWEKVEAGQKNIFSFVLQPIVAEPESSRASVQEGKHWQEPITGMEFVRLEGRCFEMGSSTGAPNERPVHMVCVDGYWIGKYEVTQGQWRTIMGANPAKFQKGDNYPVEMVSWNDTQLFITRLNNKSGGQFRLPTESEWEYACRANGEGQYCGGDDLDALAWYGDNSSGSTHPVGVKQANGFDLHDMSGNVWELCQDRYSEDYYSISPLNNPQGPASNSGRVNRGGGWNDVAEHLRSAFRGGGNPDELNEFVGFRLVFPPGQ